MVLRQWRTFFSVFYPDTNNRLASLRGQLPTAPDASQGFSRCVTNLWKSKSRALCIDWSRIAAAFSQSSLRLTRRMAASDVGQGQTENEFASGAGLLPVNPYVRTCPGALANIRSAPIR